jgi:hypothetical protein
VDLDCLEDLLDLGYLELQLSLEVQLVPDYLELLQYLEDLLDLGYLEHPENLEYLVQTCLL